MKKFANFALTAGMGLNLEGPLWVDAVDKGVESGAEQ